jgi:hypothetical protein
MAHYVNFVVLMHFAFTRKGFDQVFKICKFQCIVTCDVLVLELEHKFLDYELMNALGIIYPQYWV